MELEDGDAVGNVVYTIGKFVHGELEASKFRGRMIVSFLFFVISFNSASQYKKGVSSRHDNQINRETISCARFNQLKN